VAYSAEQVLLNKPQIYGGPAKLHWYRAPKLHWYRSRVGVRIRVRLSFWWRYQCRQALHAQICQELTEISWMFVGASVFAQISVGKLQFSV